MERNSPMVELSADERTVIRKALKFYEDVAVQLGPLSKKPETLADDLKAIDRMKDKFNK